MTPALLALLCCASLAPNDNDWPRFRGTGGTGVQSELRFPDTWDAETHLAWSIDIPGAGWASPLVLGERIYVSTATGWTAGPRGFATGVADPSTYGRGTEVEDELTYWLLCFALEDGEQLWAREVGSGIPEFNVHASNTFATETPATDGERIYVTYGALGELVAYDLEGEEVWRAETGVHPTGNSFGWGISVVTGGGLTYLQSENERGSFLAAFDAESGEERWRAERGTGSSWGTPVFWSEGERESLVALGPGTIHGYAPEDGRLLWELTGLGGGFSSSPTVDGERLYAGNSGPMSRGPLVAVRPGLEGSHDVRTAEGAEALAWNVERAGPGFPSPVVSDGLLYVLGSSAILACYDASTGERLWRERLPDATQIVASPWVAGDRLFFLDETGTTYVLRVGPEYELLHTNELEGLYWSTPSIAGDSLLLREAQRLHCIR